MATWPDSICSLPWTAEPKPGDLFVTVAIDPILKASQDILDTGYAVVKLSDVDATNLHTAITTAVRFFERPLEDKKAHGSADNNYGYRPFGVEYSYTPDRPDMNECFTV